MKRYVIYFAAVLFASGVGCSQDKPPTEVAAASEEKVEIQASAPAPVLTEYEVLGGDSVSGVEGFATPLPQGVTLSFPHNARMDVATLTDSGRRGRRVELEFFTGNSAAAMASVAKDMKEGGFTPSDPLVGGGVARQTFSKMGYGTVNARAELDIARRDHESAIGYVVMAWPKYED